VFPVPSELEAILLAFAPLFTCPTWRNARVLLIGAILALARRTVASALRAVGLADEPQFGKYHRVLSRARWSGREAAHILLGLLVAALPAGFPILLLLDETLERRKGRKIRAKGLFRDAVRSSRQNVVRCFGLRWISMMVLVPLPWCRRPWALPFLTVLAPSERTCKKLGQRHKSIAQWSCQMVLQVYRWLGRHPLVVLGDGAYAVVELIGRLQRVKGPITLVARFRWNAALYDPPPPQPPAKRGPKPRKGKRQPSLAARAADPNAAWTRLVVRWYNGILKPVDVLSGHSLWYTPGQAPVPIAWVIVRDPEGKIEDTPIVCSDPNASAQQIVEWFVLRWNIETTFEESRAHLGIETQRQWSDPAIARTTPALFGLYSIITLTALRMVSAGVRPTAQTAAWYRKQEASFSDVLALVRRRIWTVRYFENSLHQPEATQLPSAIVQKLIDHLACAA
jgi:hypothetical protein